MYDVLRPLSVRAFRHAEKLKLPKSSEEARPDMAI